MLTRAYSTLEIKAVDAEQRIIEGIASTPTPDRGGDVMEPAGAQFSLPIPFLWFHNELDPIGEVFEADVRPDGIHIKARVSKVTTPGRLKTLVDDAWAAFTAKPALVRGLSIGWKDLESSAIKGTPLRRVTKWIWGELSAVTVPMNVEATILSVKQFDQAAIGPHAPGVTGFPIVSAHKGAPTMTTQEQISGFEAKRAANSARMVELMNSTNGSTFDAAQTEEYTTLEREVESIDEHLPRLRKLEKTLASSATPVTGVTNAQTASDVREAKPVTNIIQVKSMLPKGTAFTRYAMAIAASNGNKFEASEYAKRWEKDTPEVGLYLKSAIAAGTTVDATWAAPLAVANPLAGEFIELLRPQTLLGRIPNLRRVPFNVSVPSQTAGGTYGWVGQGKVKPLTNMALATVTLVVNKIAGIIVLTEELVKLSTPSAEELVRGEMIAGIVKFMDEQFIDPAIAVSGTVSPASITNGTTPITSAGTSADNARTDIKAVMAAFVAANLSTNNAVWIMSEANAFALATAITALGQPAFPGMSVSGGTLFGIPVIATQSAGTTVALVDAQGILVADDGGVTIDVSREASLQMDTAPTDPPDAAAVYVSMFQNNLVALRAERFVTWKRARTASVKYVAQSYV